MSWKRPCHFINTPRGCLKGDQCGFLHPDGGASSSSNRTTEPRPRFTNQSQQDAPGRFQRPQPQAEAQGARKLHQPQPQAQFTPPAFDNALISSLSKNSNHSSLLFPTEGMSFTESQARIKTFMHDNFKLDDPRPAISFGLILLSMRSWESDEQRQDIVGFVAERGLKLLQSILAWERVSTSHSFSSGAMSFQQAYVPVLLFLTNDAVINTMIERNTNKLYSVVELTLTNIIGTVKRCLQEILDRKELNSSMQRGGFKLSSAIQVVRPVTLLLAQYLSIFRDAALRENKLLREFVDFLAEWITDWSLSTAQDAWKQLNGEQQTFCRDQLLDGVSRLNVMLQSAGTEIAPDAPASGSLASKVASLASHLGQMALMRRTFDPPGELREQGPRHDNDFADIQRIQIAPTTAELQCKTEPFLPATVAGAPHHLPENSVARLVDSQFRLLRQEIIAPLHDTLSALCEELSEHCSLPAGARRNQLSQLLARGGGLYRGPNGAADLRTYGRGHVRFGNVSGTAKGAAITISLPAASGHGSAKRYWQQITKRSLGNGALVAYVVQSHSAASPSVFIGTVASRYKEEASVNSEGEMDLTIVFSDASVFARAFQQPRPVDQVDLLVEVPGVLMDTLEPFLRVLQQTASRPEQMPFARYLAPRKLDAAAHVEPPAYARVPGFRFDLSELLRPNATVKELFLSPTSPESKDNARETLRAHGILDLSQADAIVDSLSREIALIQGPPGTGKSFTGVNLVKTLLKSGIPKILVICQTNHALDTFLGSLLDKGIENMVRLGSRSKDERIQAFALEALLHSGRRVPARRQGAAHRTMKLAETAFVSAAQAARRSEITSEELEKHLQFKHPEHLYSLQNPPPMVDEMFRYDMEWIRPGHKSANTLAEFWLSGRDLELHEEWLQAQLAEKDAAPAETIVSPLKTTPLKTAAKMPIIQELVDDSYDSDSSDGSSSWVWSDDDYASADGDSVYSDPRLNANDTDNNSAAATPVKDDSSPHHLTLPPVPQGKRAIQVLLDDADIWSFSKDERVRLLASWKADIRSVATDELLTAREAYESARAASNEYKSEERLALARGFNVVGCTTTGAAQLGLLLEKLKPTVLVVEEAGEVLEAHVLASLAPSLEQVLMIGDPMQLRPHVSTYALSIENTRGGGDKYRLDLSLMERLATETGIDMSQIDIQRRMRPDFADLVRPLYRNLLDHEGCLNRPNIRGMGANLAFINHTHAETSGQFGGTSKVNEYEVEMAVALARHLVKQGYNREGDICIIVTYLGQLKRVRERLEQERITTVVDERDERELHKAGEEPTDDKEDEEEAPSLKQVTHTTLAGCLRIACVDNFQGEEAKIIILSTVRNTGVDDSVDGFVPPTLRRSGVGFVKSTNRANVALSRARDGMYILGNAALLASASTFWDGVVRTLETKQSIFKGVPLRCSNHPQEALVASNPKDIELFAADGGCSRPCGSALECGHICDRKCHPGDPDHLLVKCTLPCRQLHDGCRHPCSKRCFETCGDCTFTLPTVTLPCGHNAEAVSCNQLTIGNVFCRTLVNKRLPTCEHDATIFCSEDVSKYRCQAKCDAKLPCCERSCTSKCSDCQQLSAPAAAAVTDEDGNENKPDVTPIERKAHVRHVCAKERKECSHSCTAVCNANHAKQGCGPCQEPCKATQCAHSTCNRACSEPCRICLHSCAWQACAHVDACQDPCGTPCSRLPCDSACPNKLECGHDCPSVCGEPCDQQVCPTCASPTKQKDVIDLYEFRTLADLDLKATGIDNRLITLACGHVFTVESLDGSFKLESFYIKDKQDDHWISLAIPSSEFLERPRCPTCRGAITSPRYGRVVNRALLDQHEKALWSKQTRNLESIQSQLAQIDLEKIVFDIEGRLSRALNTLDRKQPAPIKHHEQKKTLTRLLRAAEPHVMSLFLQDKLANALLWGLQPALGVVWRSLAEPILRLRERCQELCKTKSPHVKAWEAALSQAYDRARMLYSNKDPSAGIKAMAEARRAVAMPEPKSEQRVRLEAFLMALDLSLILVELAGRMLKTLQDQSKVQASAFRYHVLLIISSAKQDAAKATKLADDGKYRQHALRARVHQFRFDFEEQRCRALKEATDKHAQGAVGLKKLVKRTTEHLEDAEREMQQGIAEFRKSAVGTDMAWYNAELKHSVESIREEARALIASISRRTTYNPVTLEERRNIVEAFNFTHVGHFYRCPNGHSFVIDNCGGAMQLSVCPECREPIGGTNHNLTSNNTPDMEMEQLARTAGAQQSPWRWGARV